MKVKTIALALGAVLAATSTLAQSNWPAKPISMVVGFAPGGATDTVARVIAKYMADELKASVVVDNKAGAGGNIATDFVARAEPDGHTILLGSVGSLTVAPHMHSKLPYKLEDFAPVTMAVVFSNVLVVKPELPVQNLADYIKLAKAKPGTVTYASSGVGGAGHLAGELLEQYADVEMSHVAYKGGGPAMMGMLGGEVDSFFGTPPSVGPQVKAGKVRAIATTGATRDPLMPDVPTVAEQGYPGYDTLNWYAYVVPAKTPQDIVDKLNKVLVKVLKDPVVIKDLEAKGLSPSPSTPAELAAYMKREHETWAKVVKKAGIQAN